MAELYRHTDPDGYAISVYIDEWGIAIDAWPEHAVHRMVNVELDDEQGRRLLAALQQHYATEVTR